METFTGLEYLKIDIANNYGYDKSNWQERIKWVDNNRHYLFELAAAANNIPQYLKAVHALRNIDKASGHIMFLDATSSVVQIMACLSGDIKTARAGNLLDTGKREDIYEELIKSTNAKLPVDQHITERDAVKYPLMTHFYNKQSHEEYLTAVQEKTFLETLQGVLPGAEDVKEIINSKWNPNMKFHAFRTPDNHLSYIPVTEKVNIEMVYTDHKVQFPFRHERITTSTRSSSLLPNVIHGIDGYVVREMVRRSHTQGFELLPIHDAFGFHPNYGNHVRQNFIDILAEIADSDLLSNIVSDLEGKTVSLRKYTNTLGTEIRKSNYALS